jgi:hypothetical protein
MANSPRWKVYDHTGQYIASTKFIEDAAAVVALRGDGSQIRDGHSVVVWTEGKEDQSAGNSYDHVAIVVMDRLDERDAKREAKRQKFAIPVRGGWVWEEGS